MLPACRLIFFGHACHAGTQVFVDPAFREQFAVGFGEAATPYHQCVSTLPRVFVGTLQVREALMPAFARSPHKQRVCRSTEHDD